MLLHSGGSRKLVYCQGCQVERGPRSREDEPREAPFLRGQEQEEDPSRKMEMAQARGRREAGEDEV